MAEVAGLRPRPTKFVRASDLLVPGILRGRCRGSERGAPSAAYVVPRREWWAGLCTQSVPRYSWTWNGRGQPNRQGRTVTTGSDIHLALLKTALPG
jgi:hypothetical protein